MPFNFPKSRNKFPKPLKIVLYILVVLLILAAIYFALDRAGYIRAFQLGLQLQQQQVDQDKVVLDGLKKIMLLPGDDVKPTMATITDIDVLKKEQPTFFANAKNWDRVIVYPNIAIVYDYNANKIIQVGPVNIQPQSQTQQTVQTQQK